MPSVSRERDADLVTSKYIEVRVLTFHVSSPVYNLEP